MEIREFFPVKLFYYFSFFPSTFILCVQKRNQLSDFLVINLYAHIYIIVYLLHCFNRSITQGRQVAK